MEQDKKIFPIPGINSNIKRGDKIYHIQTEVMPGRLLVTTQIYVGGNIIHTEFASFKKHYDALIDKNPVKLKNGIKQMVQLLHQKGLYWLKELDLSEERKTGDKTATTQQHSQICQIKPILDDWLTATIENFSVDYPDISLNGFTYNTVDKQYFPVSQKSKDLLEKQDLKTILETMALFVHKIVPTMMDGETMEKIFLETENYKIFTYPYQNKATAIIITDQHNPTGLIKMELERYLEALHTITLKYQTYSKENEAALTPLV